MNTSATNITIAGAGMVGASCALWAQRRGLDVTLADMNPPGSGTSYGNAATIATYGCVPVNSASIIRDLPALLWSKTAPLRIDWHYALTNLPWMLSFLRNCTPSRVQHITDALGNLLSHTDAGLQPLVDAADAGELLVANDFLSVFSTEKGFRHAEAALQERKRQGVRFRVLTEDEVRELEPSLRLSVHAGAHFLDVRHTIDPQALIQRLCGRFVADGGTLIEANVERCVPDAEGVTLFFTDGSTRRTGQLVIAAGAHSRSIVGSGAEDLPLGTERGYHVMFKNKSHLVSRPVGWAEGGFYASPLQGGLRCAGTVEIDSLHAPKTQARIDVLAQRANEMFDGLGAPDSDWLGFRPTMPDSLPVIGPSPRSERILFAFGHQHLGLTLGGITGRIIADLAQGRSPNFDLRAFSANRFG